jgi:RNA polymerase sigma factor (sigma-70 family)
MNHQDQKYIEALLTNNHQLLRELYLKFSGNIKYMVMSNNGTAQDAADIFQESLMALYTRAKQTGFVLNGPLEPYFYGICKNKWLKKLNKREHAGVTKFQFEVNNNEQENGSATEAYFLEEERKNLLRKKLDELGEVCSKLIRLSLEGISMRDVAATMNITYAYARKKKSECMAKLVRLIKQSPQYQQLK